MQSIQKFQCFWQKFQYSKLYRAPKWIWRKFIIGSTPQDQIVPMRLGHKMRIVPKEAFLKRVIYTQQYHDENIFLAKKFIKKDSVLFDIGANIGLYACAYAQLYQNLNVRVYAIEAFPNNYYEFKKNIELNHFEKNIHAFNIALGKETGELTMFTPSQEYVGNLAGANVYSESDLQKHMQNKDHKVTIPMVTLDQFAAQHKIDNCDFMKIDIEGAEYFAFIGGKEFLKKTRPVIQTEYNQYWLNNAHVSAQDFVDFFQELNYKMAIEDHDSFRLISFEQFLKEFDPAQPRLTDLLFIPAEKI